MDPIKNETTNAENNVIKIEPTKLDESNKIELVEVMKEPPKPVFACYMCNLYATYDYYGTRPLDRHTNLIKLSATSTEQTAAKKNSSSASKKETIVLFEKAYIRDDPFSEMKALNYLILGANCSVCNKMVCVGAECSFFYYNRRFCLNCSKEYVDQDTETSNEFPQELVNELMKSFSK